MKKLFLFLAIYTACLATASADQAGRGGLVVSLGDTFGPTFKYWMSDTQAVDFGLGFDDEFGIRVYVF